MSWPKNNDSNVEMITDADGQYTLKQLRAGQYTISIQFDDALQRSWTATAIESLPVAEKENKTGVDLQLIPGVALIGKVVAADDGKPVPGVQFGISGPAHPQGISRVAQVTTGADGTFSLRVPPGDQDVYIISITIPAPGFAMPPNREMGVKVHDGTTESIQFRLPRANTQPVRGKVVDPDGNSVAGATITVTSDQTPAYNPVTCQSAGDGTFETPQFAARAKIELRAKFQDMATIRPLVLTRAATGAQVIHLQKDALVSLSGKVIDPKGKPIQGAEVDLYIRMGNSGYGRSVGKTDAQGNYKVDSLWADAMYAVEVTGDGFGETDGPLLHGRAGDVTNVVDLTLFKLDSSVAGVLLDANNNPVAGQRLQISGPRSGYNDVVTDPQGKFQTPVVSRDQLTVYVRTGQRMTQHIVHAGDQKIVLYTAAPKIARRPAAQPAVTDAPVAVASIPIAGMPETGPADMLTWQDWLDAAVLLIVGSALTILLNALAAIRGKKSS